MFLSLALKNINNFEYIQKSEILQYITHPGVRAVLEKAALTSRQGHEKFDKLAGLLTSFVDLPALLFAADSVRSMAESVVLEKSGDVRNEINSEMQVVFERQNETDTKMLGDCLRRLKDQFLKTQADQLAIEIKKQPTPEKLERLMNIQRDRLSLNKEP